MRWLLKHKFRDARNSGTLHEKASISVSAVNSVSLSPSPLSLSYFSLFFSLRSVHSFLAASSLPQSLHFSFFHNRDSFLFHFNLRRFLTDLSLSPQFVLSFTPFFVSSMSVESRLAVLIRFYSPKKEERKGEIINVHKVGSFPKIVFLIIWRPFWVCVYRAPRFGRCLSFLDFLSVRPSRRIRRK